jgi:hypothetical protein
MEKTLKVSNPLCPKCGCRAREVLGAFEVTVELIPMQVDILKFSEDTFALGDKRIRKPAGPLVTLRCGGGHEWEVSHEGGAE